MTTIFLSYAGLDREIATQVAGGLKGAGVDVWWDREGIGWGNKWIERLQEELTKCGAYVILVGSSGVRKWVKAELSIALKRHVEQDLPIFPVLLPGVTPDSLPPFLSTLQAERLPEHLVDIDYKKLAERLCFGVLAPAPISASTGLSDVCPFPGLEAFGEKEAQFFVGRQKETLDAVRYLGLGLDGVYRRWLQVEGTSGVGKSSLVKAGIIPTIKKGWVGLDDAGARQRWRVVGPMRPGADPILNLATALSKGLSHEGRTLSAMDCNGLLQGDETALKVGLRDWVPEAEALVLVIDQLEEIFTHPQDSNVRQRFDTLLANALGDQDGPLHLITTIRSDFMMQFSTLPHLQKLLPDKAYRYFLAPVDEHGLKDIVRTPARLAGLQWSDDQLQEDIVQEARGEPGALPLVENLLRLLWLEARKEKHNTLSRAVYRQLGGVGGALANSADALLESLGGRKQQALDLLTALVNVGRQDIQDTRRTVPKSLALDAAGGGTKAEEILSQLSGSRGRDTADQAPARPRLVVVSKPKDESSELVDLAHETLLRYDPDGKPYWKTLRDQITKKRREIENRQLAEALAKEWRDNRSPPWSGLATRSQVKGFRRLRGLSDDATAYVKASRRVRWLFNGVIGFAIFLILGMTWLWQKGYSVNHAILKVQSFFVSIHVLPEMQALSVGNFRQGDTHGRGRSEEQPVHEVTIKPFAVGKFEVTFEEYDRYAIAKNRSFPGDQGWGRGRRPVINVSWQEAKDYADWLSRQTGRRYRLLTESEWEYAARSEGKDAVWAGTSEEKELNQYAVYGTNSQNRTAPVGESEGRKPNAISLYDMSGNVWEWVEDCWHDNYKEAPSDGTAWIEAGGGDCGRHVVRGGSWGNESRDLRSSNRNRLNAVISIRDIGFRLAQDID